jgi:L-ribulose-5-phosphate 3-epimerase
MSRSGTNKPLSLTEGKPLNSNQRIGFMQGRLSPLINGRIQAFPRKNWKDEFPTAQRINIHLMEWTIDQEHLYENPLMTQDGQEAIRALCNEHELIIPSLTGDCFMHEPLWKAQLEQRTTLEQDFIEIAKGCAKVGIKMLIMPLVDNGRLESTEQEDYLVHFLESQADFLEANSLKVLFESDYVPHELARFMARLSPNTFGVNYDIGNSAALGLKPQEEFAAFGQRVMNVHVKDRVLGGTTVPLGTGSANFDEVFDLLKKINYQGNFILQTARAANGNHADVLSNYRDMTINWLKKHAA